MADPMPHKRLSRSAPCPCAIYAFEQTGLLVTEANEHLISDVDRAEWEAAVLEYRAKHGDSGEEDEENEWF